MIRFVAKIAAQRVLGAMPGGRALYDWAQRRVTRSVAPTDETLRDREKQARLVLALLQEARPDLTPSDHGPHLDIGAGWLPMMPLVLHQHGLRGQWLADIQRALLPAAAFAVGRWLDLRRGELPPLSPPDRGADEALSVWFDRLGMRYMAPAFPPYDLAAGSLGLITCWQVLQYPDAEAVRAIHIEAARLLRPGGLFIGALRLDDQYALADPSLPRFHFLRYGRTTWARWFDNPFTPMNRLRPSEHARLLDGLPFERLVWRVQGGGEAELTELARQPPHRDFAGYAPADLAATGLLFVLRRT